MDILKKLFPLSFKMTGSVANLIIGTIIYLVVGIIVGAVSGLLAAIPLNGNDGDLAVSDLKRTVDGVGKA